MKTTNFTPVFFLIVMLGGGTVTFGAQSPETMVLDRWSGAWHTQVLFKASVWFPLGKRQAETRVVNWILAGQFQEATIRSAEHESRDIQRYDQQNKTYQRWNFDSHGGAGFWVGTWDEKTQTMTWKLDLGTIKGSMTDRFAGADTYETKVILKNPEGAILLDVVAQHTRVKK